VLAKWVPSFRLGEFKISTGSDFGLPSFLISLSASQSFWRSQGGKGSGDDEQKLGGIMHDERWSGICCTTALSLFPCNTMLGCFKRKQTGVF
jgi:hypothetical protein